VAQIRHLKRARQRYVMVPVKDPDTGMPMRRQIERTTRAGEPMTQAVTRPDHTQPLPPRDCEFCELPIPVHTAFKILSVRRGPEVEHRYRHESCPDWHLWEYSTSYEARLAKSRYAVEHADWDAVMNAHHADDIVRYAAADLSELARSLSDSLRRMEEGFGHPSKSSKRIRDRVVHLYDVVSGLDRLWYGVVPMPIVGCEECGQTGNEDPFDEGCTEPCHVCEGMGLIPNEELEKWRSGVRAAILAAIV
jgi:hypothetical protein